VTKMPIARTLVLAACTLAVLAAFAARAAHASGAPNNSPTLMSKDLLGMAGKEVVMLVVERPPGGTSAPHRHDAQVFVYVLEGTLIMQLDGHPPVTLKPGDTFYEAPGDVHRQSANASATEPVKFLVFIVKDKGKPITLPVESAAK
jgi:quercetin dioxygenase-like cupin family protein